MENWDVTATDLDLVVIRNVSFCPIFAEVGRGLMTVWEMRIGVFFLEEAGQNFISASDETL